MGINSGNVSFRLGFNSTNENGALQADPMGLQVLLREEGKNHEPTEEATQSCEIKEGNSDSNSAKIDSEAKLQGGPVTIQVCLRELEPKRLILGPLGSWGCRHKIPLGEGWLTRNQRLAKYPLPGSATQPKKIKCFAVLVKASDVFYRDIIREELVTIKAIQEGLELLIIPPKNGFNNKGGTAHRESEQQGPRTNKCVLFGSTTRGGILAN